MIYGINGKKGSGKSTAGTLLNLIASFPEASIEEIEEMYLLGIKGSKFAIRQFAEPIKKSVSQILNCHIFDLEDPKFKEKELHPDFWVYEKIENGKTIRISFNSGINVDESFHIVKTTPRWFMQNIGTEVGRNFLGDNIWITSLLNQYKPIRVKTNGLDAEEYEEHYPDWIITDLRFQNEAEKLKSLDAILIKVERNLAFSDNHLSENALNDYKGFNFVVNNNGSIKDLIKQLHEIYCI